MTVNENGQTTVDIALLQEKTNQNNRDIIETRSWVDKLSNNVTEVKRQQGETLVVLARIESNLTNVSDKLAVHDTEDSKLRKMTADLQLSHIKVATKFNLTLGILSLIGTAVIAGAVKLFFFSSVITGGG